MVVIDGLKTPQTKQNNETSVKVTGSESQETYSVVF